jgi:hypothetical protein
LLSNNPSIITNNQSNRPSTIENLIQSKEERFSVIVPLTSARRTLPVIDTTFVVKLEESKNTTANPSPHVEIIPIEYLPTAEVIPIESLPIAEVETIPSDSQPKPPARLYFSPTLLQDDDEPELLPPVLSAVDQNRTRKKPKKNNFSYSLNFFPFFQKTKNQE